MPDGEYICGKLPEILNVKHFGPTLIQFIITLIYLHRLPWPFKGASAVSDLEMFSF
jgi:hypothetical protein